MSSDYIHFGDRTHCCSTDPCPSCNPRDYGAARTLAAVNAEAEENARFTREQRATYKLAHQLKDYVEENLIPDLDGSLASDLYDDLVRRSSVAHALVQEATDMLNQTRINDDPPCWFPLPCDPANPHPVCLAVRALLDKAASFDKQP